jgi:hypothetical protein
MFGIDRNPTAENKLKGPNLEYNNMVIKEAFTKFFGEP